MLEKIGPLIRTHRIAAGLSQSELADRAGVSQAAIGQWERGTVLPRGRNLNAVAKVLGISQVLRQINGENHKPAIEEVDGAVGAGGDIYAHRLPMMPPSMEGHTRLMLQRAERQAKSRDFNKYFEELLATMDLPVQKLVAIEGPLSKKWVVDYLSERNAIEVKHPISFKVTEDVISRTLWQLVVLREFLGRNRNYVAIIHRAPLTPIGSSEQETDKETLELAQYYERRLSRIAAEADLLGIHLAIVDTAEEAAKFVAELEDPNDDPVE